jgi:nicotinate phosphoribosyltransferase
MIESLLDTDLYKLTMQQAVRRRFPGEPAVYALIERGGTARFSGECVALIRRAVAGMGELRLSGDERDWLAETGWFGEDYLDWLSDYRFDPGEIRIDHDDEDRLSIHAEGPWARTILWEVPLLATVTEAYFAVDGRDGNADAAAYRAKSAEKGAELIRNGCVFSDFGTRRRRSKRIHRATIEGLREADEARRAQGADGRPGKADTGKFAGTSNLMWAKEFGLPPIGTIAHEWIMGIAALQGFRGANRKALDQWLSVYDPERTVALTDTYTVDLFLREFGADHAASVSGVRHDSGDPFAFIDRFVAYYESLGIDPKGKKFVFSDGIDVETARRIQAHARGKCLPVFGIGTHLTNDFPGSPALDIVMKLVSLGGNPAVKTGDDPAKATGDPAALGRAREVIAAETGREL